MSQPVWRQILENQLTENPKYTTYALSTLSPEGQPKVRFVVHRSISPSGLLILTTDTRMQKPVHLALNHTVEAAWWIEPSNVQFRITGQAYTFPLPSSSPTEVSSALQGLGLKDIEDFQGEEKEECTSEWWEEERIRLWEESMSGHLRASFARPKPGKSLEQVEHSSEWPVSLPGKSEDPKEKELIQLALTHFALIAIRPTAVEFLELKPIPNRRTQWTLQSDGTWEENKVAP